MQDNTQRRRASLWNSAICRSGLGIGAICAVLVSVALAASASANAHARGTSVSTRSRAATIRSAIATYDSLVGTAPRIIGSNGPFSVPALAKRPPKNKLLGIINCAAPVCNDYTNGAKAAAKILGWRTTTVNTPFSPQGWRNAWTTLLQRKPNVIIFSGIAPTAEILPELKQAKKQGAIVVAYAVDLPAGGSSPISFETDSPADFIEQGEGQAYGAIATQHGAPSVVILTDPTVPSWVPMRAKITSIIHSVGGTVQVLNASSSNIGTTVPGQLVTFLQAHPSVKYVLPSYDDFLPGIPEALKTAGLKDVKILGTSASQSSLGLVASGQEYSSVVHMTGVKGWWLVYAAAETVNGTPPKDANPAAPVAVAVKSNAKSFGNVANWPQSAIAVFRKALLG
jgi:ABC-type sugar transport system substrate-binding protein